MIGGASEGFLSPLVNPIKALFMAPFIDQNFAMFVATMNSDDLATLAELMRSGEITPVIDRRYPLNEVPAAIRYSEEGHARGKILVTME